MCQTLNNGWARGIFFLRASFFDSKATSNLLNDAVYREINTFPPVSTRSYFAAIHCLDQVCPGIALWIGDWTS